jgi:hypothetical protein
VSLLDDAIRLHHRMHSLARDVAVAILSGQAVHLNVERFTGVLASASALSNTSVLRTLCEALGA